MSSDVKESRSNVVVHHWGSSTHSVELPAKSVKNVSSDTILSEFTEYKAES